MILRYVKKNIYEGLIKHLAENGTRDEFNMFINFSIPVNNDIFWLIIYSGAANKKRL